MSRSRKKTLSIKYATSDKWSKRSANRKLRRVNKCVIKSLSSNRTYLDVDDFDDWWEYPSVCQLDEAEMFKTLREVSDVWGFASDGLAYIHSPQDLVNVGTWKNPDYKSIKQLMKEKDYNHYKWYIQK